MRQMQTYSTTRSTRVPNDREVAAVAKDLIGALSAMQTARTSLRRYIAAKAGERTKAEAMANADQVIREGVQSLLAVTTAVMELDDPDRSLRAAHADLQGAFHLLSR